MTTQYELNKERARLISNELSDLVARGEVERVEFVAFVPGWGSNPLKFHLKNGRVVTFRPQYNLEDGAWLGSRNVVEDLELRSKHPNFFKALDRKASSGG